MIFNILKCVHTFCRKLNLFLSRCHGDIARVPLSAQCHYALPMWQKSYRTNALSNVFWFLLLFSCHFQSGKYSLFLFTFLIFLVHERKMTLNDFERMKMMSFAYAWCTRHTHTPTQIENRIIDNATGTRWATIARPKRLQEQVYCLKRGHGSIQWFPFQQQCKWKISRKQH